MRKVLDPKASAEAGGAERMDDTRRSAHNRGKLTELHPNFAARVLAILSGLEVWGLRPRVEVAWRSADEQRKLYELGHSAEQLGFHNISGPRGEPEALAVDVLDDDHPNAVRTAFFLQLAHVARANQCDTGILFGLPSRLRSGVDTAVRHCDWQAHVKTGWAPCHVQPAGITLEEAKVGKRPE